MKKQKQVNYKQAIIERDYCSFDPNLLQRILLKFSLWGTGRWHTEEYMSSYVVCDRNNWDLAQYEWSTLGVRTFFYENQSEQKAKSDEKHYLKPEKK